MARTQISFKNSKKLENSLRKFVSTNILPKIQKEVRDRVRVILFPILRELITNSPTIQALLNNDANYQGQLGLTPPEARLEARQIIDIIAAGMDIQRSSSNFASLNVFYNKERIEQQLLSSIEGYTSKNGFEINWIDWLLNGKTIEGFSIRFNPGFARFSRSGQGTLMLEGGDWSTSELEFYEEGGFIQQIFDNPATRKIIDDIVKKEFTQVIKEYNSRR